MYCCVLPQVLKLRGILDNATRADSIVKDKYGSNREAMVLLGKPEAEITAAIPVAGSQAAAASGSQVKPPCCPLFSSVVCVCVCVCRVHRI